MADDLVYWQGKPVDAPPRPENWHEAHVEKLSFGERVADCASARIGSWTFIIVQTAIMAAWVLVNVLAFFAVIRFDEYPFVFLNLFMSAEAAFATPLILMSQNRSAERDREHAAHDYEVNVAAKAEIEMLMASLARIENEKLDLIITKLGP